MEVNQGTISMKKGISSMLTLRGKGIQDLKSLRRIRSCTSTMGKRGPKMLISKGSNTTMMLGKIRRNEEASS